MHLISGYMYRSWNKSFIGRSHIVVNFSFFYWSQSSLSLSSIIDHTIDQKLYYIDYSCLCICPCRVYILCTFISRFYTSQSYDRWRYQRYKRWNYDVQYLLYIGIFYLWFIYYDMLQIGQNSIGIGSSYRHSHSWTLRLVMKLI